MKSQAFVRIVIFLTVRFITLSKDLYTGYTLDSRKLLYTL